MKDFRASQHHRSRSFQKHPSPLPSWLVMISSQTQGLKPVGRVEGEAHCHRGQASWQSTAEVLAALCWLQARCTLFLEKKHAPHSSRQAPWHPSFSLCSAGSPHLHPCLWSTCITTGSSPPRGSWEPLGTSGL